MARRNIPAGLTSVGFQKITTNSTATVNTLNSTCIVGSTFLLSVETQSIRATFDGSSPATSTGVLLTAANSPYWFTGVKGSQLKFVRAVSGAVVQVQAWKNTGE